MHGARLLVALGCGHSLFRQGAGRFRTLPDDDELMIDQLADLARQMPADPMAQLVLRAQAIADAARTRHDSHRPDSASGTPANGDQTRLDSRIAHI
ncbi:hypothetical protein Y958_11520 [Nitrospirillum viridazoti CBAmc]|uniref:Uncharacterized protein n=1 Tax=Nitrospirillum viridazoti CBAmc TaxID=1441467 RepID=A0A248JRR5_9PROT|nr:hypothetical protein Y958_11520 [Nitrospirillum amazonense CBAmc]